MRCLLAALALVLLFGATACDEPDAPVVKQSEKEHGRMEVLSRQKIERRNGGAVAVVVLRDTKTSREYLCIEGFGVHEMPEKKE